MRAWLKAVFLFLFLFLFFISGHFDYGGRRSAAATSARVAQSWRRRRGARHTCTQFTCFTGTQVQILTPYVRAPQLVGTDIKLPSNPTDAGEQVQASVCRVSE